ncbi:L-gulonolactone oxidase [Wenyingzhuangia heitensis]|uniref:L-gulonolactone oxidase n=1 Tax=Wenyingzhuangia heitensis TaxID=1487859 RepID=A0ABX0UBB0_9FLAO|nr:D-arabinono-1,4-lactone oxidase [Wenyingzhuangia heitensis]NIJ45215.1 L-gulonolactone oxidase [Wenyingzhuangia heitensis]
MSKVIQWINWSGSYVSTPDFIEYPSSEKELLEIIDKAKTENTTVKVVGSGHSCSLVGATKKGYLIDLKGYNQILEINTSLKTIKVAGGVSLEKICNTALENKLALPNLGTIVEQSIAGAISTGTHGSGFKREALDQSVIAFTILTANGEKKVFDKYINSEEFYTAVVGIGALGIISTVTLQLVDDFNLAIQTKSISFDEMIANVDCYKTNDYMRFWWAPHTNRVQFWTAHQTNQKTTKASTILSWYQDIFKGNIMHEFGLWITSFFPNLIPQLNRFMFASLLSKENKQITNFLDGFTLPIHVKQSVMEYGIPIENTEEVLVKIKALLDQKKYKVHMPIEVRFAPKNKANLSMAYNRDTCYIGIIAYKPYGKTMDYDAYFKDVHDLFAVYKGRPHWAKVTYYNKAELNSLYPNWKAFKDLSEKLDPNKMFVNNFLKRIL